MWRIQFVALLFAMSVFVGAGVYFVEKGIQRIDGVADGPAQSFQVTQRADGKMDMTVLGREYVIENDAILPMIESIPFRDIDFDARPERFSWGNEIGRRVTDLSQKALDWMTRF